MKVYVTPGIGVDFYLDDPGDAFSIALAWIKANCKNKKWPEVCNRKPNSHGDWEWDCYTHKMNHYLEATDSGRFYTTNFDEAALFRLSFGSMN